MWEVKVRNYFKVWSLDDRNTFMKAVVQECIFQKYFISTSQLLGGGGKQHI